MSWMRFFLLLSMLGWSAAASAVLPTADLLKRNLAGLGERKLPAVEQQAVEQALEQTLGWLENAERAKTSLAQLEQQVASAPEQIRKNRQQLAQLMQQAERRQLPANASLAELEGLLAENSRQLAGWQNELNEANADIVRSQTRPERAQSEISANQKRIQDIHNQLKTAKEGGKPLLSTERMDALRAEQEALQIRNNLRQAELANNSVLQDLAGSTRELMATRVQAQEDYIATLQGLLSEKRQAASELAVHEQSLKVEKAGEDTLLLKESNLNLQLSDYLLTITERRNRLAQRSLEVRQQLDSVQQAEQAMEEQIAALQGSVLLAKILYQQKQALPEPIFNHALADQIADTRLYQFQLRQYRDSMQRPDSYVDNLLQNQVDDDGQVREAMLELMRLRSGLLERLNHELNAYLSEAISVQLNQKQLETLSQQLRTLLDEHMFWIPSNKPLDRDWLKLLPGRLQKQWKSLDGDVALGELWPVWRSYWLAFVPALLLSLGVLWKRRNLYQSIDDARSRIGHYLHDRQRFTPMAIGTMLLLSLPAFFWFSTAGWLAQLHTRGVSYEFGTALLHTAKLGLVFSVAYRLLGRQGVAELHFGWPVAQVAFLRKRLAWVALVVWLLALLVPLAQANLSALSDDVLGTVALALGLGLLGGLLINAALQQYGASMSLLGRLLALLLGVAPFVLLIALLSGYYYTVLQLSERLLMSLALVIIWVLLRAMIERGLAIAARRLAWERVERLRQSEGEEEQEKSAGEQHALDISVVNEQSLRLLRLLLLLVLAAGLYWIWADVISLFAYLDNVVLYESAVDSSAGSAVVDVSLRDCLNALLIVGMTIMLARNLPGLLEVLFLSRMNLAQGTSYAAMRLLSYSISSIGIVMTLAVLGVSWNKLQWLVAALSVGLGFGLQEIFANFISGLIILFERPVRIGDLVTIGDMSGTVTRIRIRATTITEFDRKESIIPNKVFVTERLLNWSLSDSVTRITLHIGLAYDTDLELARKLMLETMQENSRVLEDPEPVVLFLEVGDSSFNHEMRYHVGEIGDRNPSIDEVHSRLVERFRDAQIQMAFKQMDVYIKNEQGDEAHWSTRQRPAAVLTPAVPRTSKDQRVGAGIFKG